MLSYCTVVLSNYLYLKIEKSYLFNQKSTSNKKIRCAFGNIENQSLFLRNKKEVYLRSNLAKRSKMAAFVFCNSALVC